MQISTPNTNLDTASQIETQFDPNDYIHVMIDMFRRKEGDWRGNRSDDQDIVAELASEEADEYFDAALIGITDLAKLSGQAEPFSLPTEVEEAEVTLGGLKGGASLKEMRSSWRQVWTGASIITNRLRRDSQLFRDTGYPELFEMTTEDKGKVMDALFANFQDLNALRFGVKGSGLIREKRRSNPMTGDDEIFRYDKDVAQHPHDVAKNAQRRGYRVYGSNNRPAMHPAAKITPEEFVALRRSTQGSSEDMDKFANDVAYLKDVAKAYNTGGDPED